MNQQNAIDNIQADTEQVDYDLNQSIKMSECEHKNTTRTLGREVRIFCNDCPRQWSESEWCEYKLRENQV